jgi:hypothetical protein
MHPIVRACDHSGCDKQEWEKEIKEDFGKKFHFGYFK